jgi:hypothetical protein
MSIQDEILSRVSEGRLHLLSPALAGSRLVRRIYVTPEVRNLIEGPWASASLEDRSGTLYADLEVFICGQYVPVALDPIKGDSLLKRLFADEVWEFRSRAPKPGIRVLGRFAARDQFIAIDWYSRDELPGPGGVKRWELGPTHTSTWDDAIERCKARWNVLFPAYKPLTADPSNDLDQYASKLISF